MQNRITELAEAGKFAIVGVANTLLDMGLFALLAHILGVNIYFSQFISYSAGVLNSYVFNRKWTFKSSERFFSPTLIRFLLLNVAMLLLSMVLLWLFADVMGLHKLIAKCVNVAITLAASFVINRLWVFSS